MQFRLIVVTHTHTQTNTQTHRQDWLQYTALLSLARSVTNQRTNTDENDRQTDREKECTTTTTLNHQFPVSVTNLFSACKLRHKNTIGGATWEWGANCPCDGGSSMSSSETWNTEVCCTVVAYVVIHSRFVVQPQKSDGDQMKCQCEEPLAGP